MEHGDSSERGQETEPLLDKNQPVCWNAAAVVLAFYGIYTNLVVYLKTVLHWSNASSAANATIWNGTSFFTSLIGAYIADTYWGNYPTVFAASSIYLLGLVIITSTALIPSLRPTPCERPSSCPPATAVQNLVFFSGLYLVAFGSGGVKGSLLPLGADQFDDKNLAEREQKGLFFSCFYVSVNTGILISGTLIVWVQENVDWAIGFSISALCLALALSALIISKPVYRLRTPSGSPLKRILQVLVASFRKTSSEIPIDTNLLYEIKDKNYKQQRLEQTIVSDTDLDDGEHRNPLRLGTITEVEELKALLRLLPIWTTGIIFHAAYAQMFTTFIQQGSTMDTKIWSFSIPPSSLLSFEVISVMLWVLLYNKIIVPITKKWFSNGVGLTQLQRMGIGRFLCIAAMATAALLEGKRLERINNGIGLTNIAWQLPQYFIFASSEMFNNISQVEFFYDQAPGAMKSLCSAFGLLTIALGSYLSSFIITVVQLVTARDGSMGWIPDDLNNGHLDHFFWAFAGISAVNFTFYVAFARDYTLKKVIPDSLPD